jgi:hypothetical protein
LQNADLLDRADVVKVIWSTPELEAAKQRADEQLAALTVVPVATARDQEANSVVIEVPDDVTAGQLRVVEAAGVSVQVTPGASWAYPAPG